MFQPGTYQDGVLGTLNQPGVYRDGSLGVLTQPGAVRDGTLGLSPADAAAAQAQNVANRAAAIAASRGNAARKQAYYRAWLRRHSGSGLQMRGLGLSVSDVPTWGWVLGGVALTAAVMYAVKK